MRVITVRIHDTTLGIWQGDPNDPSFKSEVFGGLIRQMRDRGWKVARDPETAARYPSISFNYRLARRGDLRASLTLGGRHIEVQFWAETWPADNRNGRRYDFSKRSRLRYLDRLRVELEFGRITAWLAGRAAVKVTDTNLEEMQPAPGRKTAAEWIAESYARSWHTEKDVGRPVCTSRYNDTALDGGQIVHGAKVWFVGSDGRIRSGVAHYALNNCWRIVVGRYGLYTCFSHDIFAALPTDLRRKRNEGKRRERLEKLLGEAVRSMDFARATVLRDLLFGKAPTFLIWARDHQAYYRSNRSGYTTDSAYAGRYTREEAERECKRVPHELSMVMPDGRHVRFDREAA